MKEPDKSPQQRSPPGRPPPIGFGEATKSDAPPRPHGLLFLIAILKQRQDTGSSKDKR